MADIYLAEFEKLKDEQISRSAHRDRLFHLTLVLFGGGITIALTKDADMKGLLLLLPVIAFIAGTSHIACDRRISSIGSYIKNTLTKRIADKEQLPTQQIFEWESFIDSDKLRRGRKVTQFLSNFFLYVVSGLGATAWYCFDATHKFTKLDIDTFFWCAILFDIGLMATMAWQLIRHAYIGRSKERSGPRRPAVIRALARYTTALIVASLAGLATFHFADELVARADQTIVFAILPFWPITRAALAAGLAFILGGGVTLLTLRR